MSKILLTAWIFIICSMGSCKKKEVNPPSTFTALINGIPWQPRDIRIVDDDTTMEITFERYNEFGEKRETYTFNLIKKNNLVQRIYPRDYKITHGFGLNLFSGFFTSIDDGDVVCDAYNVLAADSINNFLQIESQSNNYKEITGRLNATYYRFDSCRGSTWQDTLRITNGKFHLYFD